MIKYHISSRIIHWLMAALIISLLICGIYMTDFLSKESENRMMIYNLHKSFGLMIMILIFIRIFNRLIHKVPAMPQTIPVYERILAQSIHFLLYFLMILTPLSGYLMSSFFGFPVSFFALQLPQIVAPDLTKAEFFVKTHSACAFLLIGALALHILGALKHRFFDKPENDVLGRIV